MKKILKFFAVIFILFVTLSCKNHVYNNSKNSYIKVGVSSAGNSFSRTIMQSADVTELTDIILYKDNKAVDSWDVYADLSEAYLEIPVGIYDFKLTGKIGESTFSGTITDVELTGNNGPDNPLNLDFYLTLSDRGSGTGFLEARQNFTDNENICVKVKGGLFDLDDENLEIEGFELEDLQVLFDDELNKYYVVYQKDEVPSGSYWIKICFYDSAEEDAEPILLNDTIVNISSDLESTGKLTDFIIYFPYPATDIAVLCDTDYSQGVAPGTELEFTTVVLPLNSTDKVQWEIVSGSDYAELTYNAENPETAVLSCNEPGVVKIKAAAGKVSAEETIVIKTITVKAKNTSIKVGSEIFVFATVLPLSEASDIEWSISDESIAVLNAEGTMASLTAVAGGNVTVTAASGIFSDSIDFSVNSINVEATQEEIGKNDSTVLTAVVLPEPENEDDITWEFISGETCASLDTTSGSSVTLTGVSGGVVKIVAKYKDISFEKEIVVKELSVQVQNNIETITPGDTVSISALVLPQSDSVNENDITWEIVSGDSAASLNKYTGSSVNLTGVAGGYVTVKASYEIYSETVTVKVCEFTLNADKILIGVDGTVNLTTSLVPSDETAEIYFNITDGFGYASVNETSNGVAELTGVAGGNVTVTASYGELTSSVNITVQSISVESTYEIIGSGAATQINAVTVPEADEIIWEIVSGGSSGILNTTSGSSVTLSGNAAGYVTVKASVNGFSDSVTVTVKSIAVQTEKTFLKKDGTAVLSATVLPSEFANDVNWEFAYGADCADISSYSGNSVTVTGKAGGKVKLKAYTQTSNGRLEILTDEITVKTIGIRGNTSVGIDKTIGLSATVIPDEHDVISWSISNTTNADFDGATTTSSGDIINITGHHEGTVIVTASTGTGSNAISATHTLSIADKVVNIETDKEVIGINGVANLTASTSDSSDVTWEITSGNTLASLVSDGNSAVLTSSNPFAGGYVTVKATSGSVYSTINIAVKTLTITADSTTVSKGGTTGIYAQVLPADLTDAVLWSWDNEPCANIVPTTGTDVTLTGVAGGRVTVTATSGSETASQEFIIEDISVSAAKSLIDVNGTTTLTAVVLPSNLNQTFNWTSSDNSVIQISGSGSSVTATGKKSGTARITVSWGTVQAQCTITVKSVSVSVDKTKIAVGSKANFTANVQPESLASSTLWSITSGSEYGTLSKTSGANTSLTGLAAGIVTVTATVDGVDYENTVYVQAIDLTASTDNIGVNGTAIISANCVPAVSGDNVIWTSSDSTVATVQGSGALNSTGTVTGKKAGTVTITASWGEVSKAVTLNVRTVALSSSLTEIYKGGTDAILTATVNPSAVPVWTISDETVATLTPAGSTATVSAKKAGTVTVTATCGNVSASQAIICKDRTITITSSDDTMYSTGSVTLQANVMPDDGTAINWTITSGDTLASLSALTGTSVTLTGSRNGSGTVTVKATSGTATITKNITVVTPAKSITITGAQKIKKGSSTTYTSTVTGSEGETVKWYVNNAYKATGTSYTYTGTTAGVYTIKASLTGYEDSVYAEKELRVVSLSLASTRDVCYYWSGFPEITATVVPSDETLTWTFSKDSSLTGFNVDASGATAAVNFWGGYGDATVTCAVDDIVSENYTISVIDLVSSADSIERKTGTATLTLQTGSAILDSDVQWTCTANGTLNESTGKEVVLQAGEVTTGTVTVSAAVKGVTLSKTIDITNPAVAGVAITTDVTATELLIGDRVNLTATYQPENAVTNTTWTVSNINYATLSTTSGSETVLTAKAAGTVTVTATCGTKSATKSYTIKSTANGWIWRADEYTGSDHTTYQTTPVTVGTSPSAVYFINQYKFTTKSERQCEGYTFSKCVQLNKAGSTTEKYASFTVNKKAIVTIYGMSSGSDEGSELTLASSSGELISFEVPASSELNALKYAYTGSQDTLKVYCSSGSKTANVFGIRVEYADSIPAVTLAGTSSLIVGRTGQVTSTVSNISGTPAYTWYSENGAVATVTANGTKCTVRGISSGSTYIVLEVKTSDGVIAKARRKVDIYTSSGTMTYTLDYATGQPVQSSADFFTLAGNTKLLDSNPITYNGVEYTRGLKLDSNGSCTFTPKASGTATIVVAIYTGTATGIKINGVESAKSGTQTYVPYTITTSVTANTEYVITKGTKETTILYIKVE